MAKIEYIKNVISDFYKEEILAEINRSFDTPIWVSSHKWSEVLTNNMRPILMRNLENEKDTLHSILCSKTETLRGLTPMNPVLYLWEPGSHIDWHDDAGWTAAASIYLTTQDRRGGGAFAWEEDDGTIKMIFPEQCSAIIQSENTNHHVTMIHPTNPSYRMSIQIFYR